MKHRTAALFGIIVAVSTLSLADGNIGRAQQTMSTPFAFDPDMPDATRAKQGITHTGLLRSDLAKVSGQEVIVWTPNTPREPSIRATITRPR